MGKKPNNQQQNNNIFLQTTHWPYLPYKQHLKKDHGQQY